MLAFIHALDKIFVVLVFVRQHRIITFHTVVCTYFVNITNIGGIASQNIVLSGTIAVLILAAGHICNWFRHRAAAGLRRAAALWSLLAAAVGVVLRRRGRRARLLLVAFGRLPGAGHGVILFVSIE